MKLFDVAIGTANKVFTLAKHHYPTIALVGGSAAIITGTVLACRATLKADSIIDIHNAQMEKIALAKEKADPGEYTESDQRRDKLQVYSGTVFRFARLYAPAIGLSILGFTAIFSGFNIINRRYGLAVAAFMNLDRQFTEYRNKVIKEYGNEVDLDFFSPEVETHEISHELPDADDNEKMVEENIDVICLDDFKEDDVTRLFDYRNPKWQEHYLFAENFLINVEHHYTRLLQAGRIDHVFLNTMLKDTGFEETGVGHFYGKTREPGCSVCFNITPYYIVFDGDDDEQFPMMITVPTTKEYDEETGHWTYRFDEYEYSIFREMYEQDETRVGYILRYDVDTDENGIPRSIYNDVFGK